MRAYYFGCYDQPGHVFWEPEMRTPERSHRVEDAVPWSMGEIDGGLAPRPTHPTREPTRRDPECAQGVAALHHRWGWSALALWDRTGDSRPGSHSTFLLERGDATFEEMVAMAREHFPEIVERWPFAIVPCRRNR